MTRQPKTCGCCSEFCPDHHDFLLSGYCKKLKHRVDCGDVCKIILIV